MFAQLVEGLVQQQPLEALRELVHELLQQRLARLRHEAGRERREQRLHLATARTPRSTHTVQSMERRTEH